mmetsp:Transcript_13450/g.26399  ORF Transcript_13450/g.26399 Transcript_13450/m.26399 type:complete len:221 (+) Transcript_13450:42-704(+)
MSRRSVPARLCKLCGFRSAVPIGQQRPLKNSRPFGIVHAKRALQGVLRVRRPYMRSAFELLEGSLFSARGPRERDEPLGRNRFFPATAKSNKWSDRSNRKSMVLNQRRKVAAEIVVISVSTLKRLNRTLSVTFDFTAVLLGRSFDAKAPASCPNPLHCNRQRHKDFRRQTNRAVSASIKDPCTISRTHAMRKLTARARGRSGLERLCSSNSVSKKHFASM